MNDKIKVSSIQKKLDENSAINDNMSIVNLKIGQIIEVYYNDSTSKEIDNIKVMQVDNVSPTTTK